MTKHKTLMTTTFLQPRFVPISRRFRPAQTIPALMLLGLLISPTPTAASGNTESWFIIRFDDKPVGFEQIKSQPAQDAPQSVLKCYRKTELNLNRMGQNLTVQATLWTTQTKDGVLSSFNLKRVDGTGARVERSGTYNVDDRSFTISERAAATRRDYKVRAPREIRSPILSLWLPQMATTSARRINLPVFFPETAGVASVSADRRPNRRLRLDGKSIDAGRFEFYPVSDPTKLTTLLTDSNLGILRQEKLLLGRTLSMERATADVALAAVANKSLDLDAQATVPVDRLLSSTGIQRTLVLELHIKNGFLPSIPNTPFQVVELIDDASMRITLTKPELPRAGIHRVAQTNHPALAASHWMPTTDPALQRLALMTAGSENDAGKICRRLEAAVHAKMRRSPFSTSMLPANDVIRTFKGDCTEHAVLLATLMRIKGVPARIASGLVHTNSQFGFVGHTWVEALVEGQWIPFDSTMRIEGVGATHIKLQHSEMSNTMTSGASLFLPVLELTGRATIHVVSDG